MADDDMNGELARLRRELDEMQTRLSDRLNEAATAGRSGIRAGGRRALALQRDIAGRGRGAVEAFQGEIEEWPLASVSTAFLAGAVAGALLALSVADRRRVF